MKGLAPSLQAKGHLQGHQLRGAVVSSHGPSKLRRHVTVQALSETVDVEVIAPAAAPAAVPEAVSAPAVPEVPELPKISLPADLPTYPGLGEASEQASKAVQGLSGGVGDAAAGVGDKAAELANAANQATAQLTESANKAAADLTAAVSGVTGGITSNVSNLTSSLGQGASDVAGSVGSTVDSALSAFKGGLEQVKGNVDQATAGVSSTVGAAFDQVNSTTQQLSAQVSDTFSSATAAVSSTIDAANVQITAVTTQVGTAVDATTQQVLDVLPPPVKDAAVAVGGAVGAGVSAAASAAVSHPREAAVVAAAVAVPTAISYYKGRYAGYAGELSPGQLSVLLQEDKVFLVDIRPEETRESEGLPELKLGARFKVAAYTLQTGLIPKRVAREVGSADELQLLINAAYIAGLPQCQGNLTKIVVMDSTGSDKARDLARALVTLGYSLSYVLEGGFKGWVAAELPIVEGTAEYDASTGAVLSDELEVIGSKVSEVASTVAQPQVGLPLVGGGALLTYAVLNYHTTLKFIGVLGVMLTITNKLLSYESPRAAFDDITGTVAGAAKKLSSIKPPSLPKAPRLPKLPGQDQAATTTAAAAVPAGFAGLTAAAAASDEEQEGEEEVREHQPQQQVQQ